MKIIFVGTGSVIPSPKQCNGSARSYSAIYVEASGTTFLFDIGPGTLTKLQSVGIDTRLYPKHLLMSHYHIDHCQDYPGMVKGRLFDLKTGGTGKNRRLSVYGPRDLKRFTSDLFSGVGRWHYMDRDLGATDILNLHEVDYGHVAKSDGWKITCLPVRHYDGVAYRLDAEGKSFVFSGDMIYDENIAILGKNADLVAIECSFPDRKGLKGLHLCPEDVGKLGKKGKFGRILLTHLYPACEGREKDMVRTVEKLSGAETQVAHDFMTIIL